MPQPISAPSAKATSREWIGLAVLALPCLLYSMDLTVLNLAIPHLSADLKPGASQMLWIMDIYGFFVAGSLITMGTLGDRIGRRKLLLIGAAAFGVTSLLAAFATSAGMLIFARALLGIAAATLAPSTLSLIRNMFLDDRQRTFAIGVWIASFSAGGAIGPLVGGVMLEHFWWGSVFLLNVPVMLLLLALGPLLLPEFRDPDAGRLDLFSAAQSVLAVLAVIYGLKRIAEDGFGPMPALAIVIGLLVGTLFVRRQLRLDDPLIDMSLFRVPALSASLAINIFGLFIVFGAFLFLAQYLQLVLGMEPLEAGIWLAPSGIIFAIGSMVTPALVQRLRPSTIIATGFVISAAGFAILTQTNGNGALTVLAGLILLSMGFAPVATLTTDLVMTSAPPERAGAASAISETSFEFGGAMGIAVLGSVFTALYRTLMTGFAPDSLPSAAIDAARDTLGGALETARQLPAAEGASLVAAARDAFTQSFEMTAAISTVVALATAVFAALMLRGPHDRSGADRETEAALAAVE